MDKKIVVYNIMEQIIEDKVKKLIKEIKMCTCDQCCSDVIALALNDLPPRYAVSRVGKVITRLELLDEQTQTDIITAIMFAIKKVSKSPHHNVKEVTNLIEYE